VKLSPYCDAIANEIDWQNKVRMQAAAQKWVCHAISNTTNLPENIDVETVKKVYELGWKTGCKGITVYREGSRTGVLISNKKEESEERNEIEFVEHQAPKRPDILKCDIYQSCIKSEDWTILVGLLNGKPYEVIGGLSEFVQVPRKYKNGELRKRARKTMPSKYDLICGDKDDPFIIKDTVAVFDNPNNGSFTRTLSLVLRHGAPIQFVVEQLQKDKNEEMFSFSRVIARCLKNYIKDGTKSSNKVCDSCGSEDSIIYQEGCTSCKVCGNSKCG
jgi:ribonucleoside-diphosphate reductase alpha chain